MASISENDDDAQGFLKLHIWHMRPSSSVSFNQFRLKVVCKLLSFVKPNYSSVNVCTDGEDLEFCQREVDQDWDKSPIGTRRDDINVCKMVGSRTE
jgi:hypothetical protein